MTITINKEDLEQLKMKDLPVEIFDRILLNVLKASLDDNTSLDYRYALARVIDRPVRARQTSRFEYDIDLLKDTKLVLDHNSDEGLRRRLFNEIFEARQQTGKLYDVRRTYFNSIWDGELPYSS